MRIKINIISFLIITIINFCSLSASANYVNFSEYVNLNKKKIKSNFQITKNKDLKTINHKELIEIKYHVCKVTKRHKQNIIKKENKKIILLQKTKKVEKKDWSLQQNTIKSNKKYNFNVFCLEKIITIKKENKPFEITSLLDPFPD